MRIVGLDPGASFGYAWTDSGEVEFHQSGVWDLKPRRWEGGGFRFLRLNKYLRELLSDQPVGADGARQCAVFFEEVRRHKGVDASHAYGGYVATISSVCEELVVPYQGIAVGTIKKLATGKGNAGKPALIEAAYDAFGDSMSTAAIVKGLRSGERISDDQADALWCLRAGLVELGYDAAT